MAVRRPRMRVLIVGASKKPERYAHMAMKKLLEHAHEVVLFNPSPAIDEIEGKKVIHGLSEAGPVDTVTLYVGPANLAPMVADIVALKPRRIISNPGTELGAMEAAAREAGIEYLQACTLVLLGSGQF